MSVPGGPRWGAPIGPVEPEPVEPAAPVVPLRGPHPDDGAGPVPMAHHDKMRIRAAAFRAKRVYPGPVGDLISRELLSWEDFGYVLGGSGVIMPLVDHVLKQQPAEAVA